MAGRAGKSAVEGGVAEAVIGRPPLRILQRLIGLVDFLETMLGPAIAVAAIGMAFLGQAPERGLDIGFGRPAGHTENFVVAAL